MTIQDWGSFGDFLGAADPVTTLLYPALQIRANTAALRAVARRSVGATGIAFASSVSGSRSATRVFRLSCTDFRALDAQSGSLSK